MELPTEKLSSGALGFGLCHRWKCEESFQEATTRRLQFLFMSLYLELGKKIGLPQPPKLKSWKGKKELISPIQFDDSPNYKLHLVPGFALATFDYTGLPMLIYKPIYSTSQKKKKTYLYRRQLRNVPSFFSRQGSNSLHRIAAHRGLHLPILARELLDRGALLADGAWWIQEICGSVNRRWGDGAIFQDG